MDRHPEDPVKVGRGRVREQDTGKKGTGKESKLSWHFLS